MQTLPIFCRKNFIAHTHFSYGHENASTKYILYSIASILLSIKPKVTDGEWAAWKRMKDEWKSRTYLWCIIFFELWDVCSWCLYCNCHCQCILHTLHFPWVMWEPNHLLTSSSTHYTNIRLIHTLQDISTKCIDFWNRLAKVWLNFMEFGETWTHCQICCVY